MEPRRTRAVLRQGLLRLDGVCSPNLQRQLEFRFSEPGLLFTTTFKHGGGSRQPYDTIDGQTLVINRRVADRETSPLTLVVNALVP